MKRPVAVGDLVKIDDGIRTVWRDGTQWGTIALVTQVEGMMITLVCDTGFVKELPVQLSPRYLWVINETG